MRRVLLAVALLLAATATAQEPASYTIDRLPTSLEGEWLFRSGHDPAWASPFRERRSWERIAVPGAWERRGHPRYDGHAWYRVSLFIPSSMAEEELGLEVGLIGDADEVFLNGRRIGSTGDFPPRFDKATIAHRFYLLPREVVRYGEHNELAVHVYNQSRFGGLLGPAPRLDRQATVLRRQFVRDLLGYCLATMLLTIAAIHLALVFAERGAWEHAAFAGFLACVAAYVVSYAHFGPAMLLGHSAAFRISIVAFLAAIALFPTALYAIVRRSPPVLLVVLQVVMSLGAAFALVWRNEADLYWWVYLAEIGVVATGVLSLRSLFHMLRRGHPWARSLLVVTGLFIALVVHDILVDLTLLARPDVLAGDLLSPLGAVPFAVVFSLALGAAWIERRWGEPLDHATGLMPREPFLDRLAEELVRSRRSATPVSVALLRLRGGAGDTGMDQIVARAVPLLRRTLRQIDLLARYDRDTFALLLADTEERAAMTIVERLRRTLAEASAAAGSRVSTAAGVAEHRSSRGFNAVELVESAEAALYAAISEGADTTATAP